MKPSICYWLLLVFCLSCNEKNKDTVESDEMQKVELAFGSQKIKVYLLGSFHFAQMDSTYNVMDSNHQTSIEELCNLLAIQEPDKIFVERQPEYEFQNKLNKLYKTYQETGKLVQKNEAYQLGFRLANKLGHSKVYQCDNPGQHGWLSNKARDYAEENGQMAILESRYFTTVRRFDEMVNDDSIRQSNTLLEYTRWINSDAVTKSSHAMYVTNYPQIGSYDYYNYDEDNTLIGAEITADWYKRNIMIYTKMINQLDYKEDAIMLIIGGDHVPILKDLFAVNPKFTVIEVEKWLGKSSIRI